jgi:hypothetical protein
MMEYSSDSEDFECESCGELSQWKNEGIAQRSETCSIGSSKYKNLKLKKKEEEFGSRRLLNTRSGG